MTIGAGKLPASWVGPCAGRTFWAECGVRWDSSATGHFNLDNFDCSSQPKLRARIRHGELVNIQNIPSWSLLEGQTMHISPIRSDLRQQHRYNKPQCANLYNYLVGPFQLSLAASCAPLDYLHQ